MVTEHDHANSANTNTAVLTATGVAAGSDLIVACVRWETGVRTYTASSNVDGAFTSVVSYTPRGSMSILRRKNVTAGSHTVTVTMSSPSTFYAWLFEVPGLDQSADAVIPTGNGYTDPSAGGTHYAASSSGVDVTDDAVIITVGCVNSSVTSSSPGSGYTQAEAAFSNRVLCQYREVTGALADERGQWSTAGARVGESTMAAFYLSGGGGGGGGAAVSWRGPWLL